MGHAEGIDIYFVIYYFFPLHLSRLGIKICSFALPSLAMFAMAVDACCRPPTATTSSSLLSVAVFTRSLLIFSHISLQTASDGGLITPDNLI